MTSITEVIRFLNDFDAKYKVFGILFRDERQKNTKALLQLEITPLARKAIIESLSLEDFSEGPLDDKLYGIGNMWVFGKIVKKKEIYIKISLGIPGSNVICISFHEAQAPMGYPYKNKQ